MIKNLKNERIRQINNHLSELYNIEIDEYNIIGNRSYKIKDSSGEEYFLKETNFNTLEKYQFLYNQGVNNILYPLINKNKNFVSNFNDNNFYISRYVNDLRILDNYRVKNLYDSINYLHTQTSFKKQLDPKKSRNRFDELSNQLDYKFKVLETYIRSLEIKDLSPSMMPILGNYQYILDAKKELIRLQKRIISSVKAKESVNYSFIHNNPSLDHLINNQGNMFLTSIDEGKIGISSLDMAKFYVENEYLDVDFKSMILDFSNLNSNPFYYDYFRFLVLVIYIKKITINQDLLINVNSFVTITNSIKKYFDNFKDIEYSE